ncbi:MAG: DsbA family oxidoreductase [Rhodospirillaceae bacterium]|nr:DsbA family oxidoreductase [Rhodospirillaceae bacterium]
MRIAIHFDAICPWCFIGHKRLALALAQRPQIKPTIIWRPYFLNPDLPDEGIAFSVYVERKFGGTQRAQRLLTTLEEIGRSVGLSFDFKAIRRVPPTMPAHLLIRLAHRSGKQTEVAAAVFAAHFLQGHDIGDFDVLRDIGLASGLSAPRIAEALADTDMVETLRAEAETAQHAGTLGVPLFVLNDAFTITGAHEPEVLLRLLDVAAAGEEDNHWKTGNFTPPLPRFPPTLP